MPRLSLFPFVVGVCLAACTPTPPTPQTPPPADDAPATAPTSQKELMGEADAWKVLAPSPLELEKQVVEAGLGSTLAGLVPAEYPPMPATDKPDAVAFRTGVVFSYVLLSGRKSDKATFLSGVRSLRDGMAALGTGKAWLSEMDEAISYVENDAASRQDLLNELDGLVESSVPEEGWGPEDTTGPLVQAGAWLTGMHLTARAIVETDQPKAADKLLKRPEVAGFFLEYLGTKEGSAQSGPFRTKVASGLEDLKSIASQEHISIEDTKRIAEITDGLIQVLRPDEK